MKTLKYIIIVAMLSVTACNVAGRNVKVVDNRKIPAFVQKYKGTEGVEIVELGAVGTSFVKGLIRHGVASSGDANAKALVEMIKGVKALSVMDFDDCAESVRARINDDISGVLKADNLLMEVRDENDVLGVYATLSEDGGTLSDIVIYCPNDCALICLSGRVSTGALTSIMQQ